MALEVGPTPRVNPASIPASGGGVTVSFSASAIGKATKLRAEYHIEDQPYVFEGTADPKVAVGTVETVSTAGDDYPKALRLKKSPPSAPKQMDVRVRIHIFEVDSSRVPVKLPSGGTKAPTKRTAVITIE